MQKHRTSIEFPIDLWEELERRIPSRKRTAFIIDAIKEKLIRESMKCIILCGGPGIGMGPLTTSIPKSMMPVGYKPILEHIILKLKRQGVYNFILAVSYLGEPIIKYFGDGSSLGVRIDYSIEKAQLGTAGAVKNAEKKLNETFLTVYGDILFNEFDVHRFVKYHKEKGGVATMTLVRVDDASRFGLVSVDEAGRVIAFREKPRSPVPGLVNAGIYVFESSIFDYIPQKTPVSFEEDVFPELADRGKLYAYVHDNYWIDIGTPTDYERVCKDFFEGLLKFE